MLSYSSSNNSREQIRRVLIIVYFHFVVSRWPITYYFTPLLPYAFFFPLLVNLLPTAPNEEESHTVNSSYLEEESKQFPSSFGKNLLLQFWVLSFYLCCWFLFHFHSFCSVSETKELVSICVYYFHKQGKSKWRNVFLLAYLL